MKHLLLLLLAVVFTACIAPQPTPAPPPAVSPSLVPSISPSLIPSVAPSLSPIADMPTSEPTRAPDQPISDLSFLPLVEKTLDFGQARFADFDMPVPLALDAQAERLYVSLSPSRTVVLDANTLASVDEIPFGGALSVDPAANRLYMGVPGGYAYRADGSSVITAAELKLFDTANLALLRSLALSDTSTVPPLVAVDPLNDKVYITQIGVIIASTRRCIKT